MSTDDDVMNIELDYLTVGEIEEVEELAGQAIDTFGQPGERKGKFLRALAFVTRKRTDPEFTWEESANLKVNLSPGVPVPPTDAAG